MTERMPWIKMRVVKSVEFDKAWMACQLAFGCFGTIKRTLIWICAFSEEDCQIIRETLEEVGSVYRGHWDD